MWPEWDEPPGGVTEDDVRGVGKSCSGGSYRSEFGCYSKYSVGSSEGFNSRATSVHIYITKHSCCCVESRFGPEEQAGVEAGMKNKSPLLL